MMLALRLLDEWFHPISNQSTQILEGKTEFRGPQCRQFWSPRAPTRVSLADHFLKNIVRVFLVIGKDVAFVGRYM